MSNVQKRFEVAVATRQFEIDLFWKRALFFWGFIAAGFAGIGALRNEAPFFSLVIAEFEVVCCLAWALANRGSKYWQGQWEAKVEGCEVSVVGRLFKNRAPEKKIESWWKKAFRGDKYSVSKLTIAVSDFAFVTSVMVLAQQIWSSCLDSRFVQYQLFWFLSTVGLLLFIGFLPFAARSDLHEDEEKAVE
jgi:hypothetical protein